MHGSMHARFGRHSVAAALMEVGKSAVLYLIIICCLVQTVEAQSNVAAFMQSPDMCSGLEARVKVGQQCLHHAADDNAAMTMQLDTADEGDKQRPQYAWRHA
jgi:hypothetical protein